MGSMETELKQQMDDSNLSGDESDNSSDNEDDEEVILNRFVKNQEKKENQNKKITVANFTHKQIHKVNNDINFELQKYFLNQLYTRNGVGNQFSSGTELRNELKILVSMTQKNIDYRRRYKTSLPENTKNKDFKFKDFKIRSVDKTTGISPENEQVTTFCLRIYSLLSEKN